ncbi:MAG TPA: GAF domain-containing protein [Erysipelothrix sp.]|nr:GAF domain-containing protein [Erysipelothrix sp.]
MLNSYHSLISNSPSDLTTYSNTTAFLMETLPNCNWVGFYFVHNNQLILGPFQGKVACEVIPFDKGVCGHVATTKKPIIVDDVHLFPGHIACDEASQSEMVIPLFYNDEFIGVLDIDAPIKNRFTNEDLKYTQDITKRMFQEIKKGNLLP